MVRRTGPGGDVAVIAALRPVTPVSILAAELEDLASEQVGTERFARAARLAAGLEPYVGSCTTPASADLRRVEERTRAATHLEREMLSGHVEGQLLRFLVKVTRARRVLEIGLFTGYSALAMAEALPVGGRLVACELDAELAAFAQSCFEESAAGHLIEVRVGPAARSLDRLAQEGEEFDLVFVDADKPGYAGYLDQLLECGLLADEGLICVDNTLLQGEPWLDADQRSANGEAITRFNRIVAEDGRVEQVLVPVRDGLTLIRRA